MGPIQSFVRVSMSVEKDILHSLLLAGCTRTYAVLNAKQWHYKLLPARLGTESALFCELRHAYVYSKESPHHVTNAGDTDMRY